MEKWGPFISDCLTLLDGDGAFHHWKYPGAYVDQPWLDQQIYGVIRAAWVKHQNDKIEQQSKRAGKPGVPRRARLAGGQRRVR